MVERLRDQSDLERLTGELARDRVIEPAGVAYDLEDRPLLALPRRSGRSRDVRRVVLHPLVEQPPDADTPAVVDVTDPVTVGHAYVGQELLAELAVAVEHLDAVHGDARRVEREDEHGQAAVLRHVPVGA